MNKKLAINAGLFVGSIALGTMLGWGAWLYNNHHSSAAPARIEAGAIPAARPAKPTAQPVIAVTPAAPVAVAELVAPAAPAPAAAAPQSMQDYRNATPEQQQQMMQNFAQTLSRSQDPRAQQMAVQMQTPEGQAQLREQANALLQQFRRGGNGGQGGGGQGFANQRVGGPNPANPALPADVAAGEDNSADGG